jgi:DNA transposition AAA+ family ATPase
MTYPALPTNKPVIDALMDRERIKGAARMLPEGTDAAAVTESQAKEIWHQVSLFLKEQGLSRKDVARDIGYSPGVISEVLNGQYKGDWRQVSIDLDAWLEGKQRQADAPSTTQFVWSSVAQEIRTVSALMCQLRRIGLVYGPETSGIGKTIALQAVHQETPGSLFVTCDKVESNPTGLLRSIAASLRMNQSAKNATLYKNIKDRLRGTSRLLIVDQVHNLRFAKNDKPFYILCDLWDATRAPQLWCGTADLVSYLRRGQSRGDESLAQIRSRIGYVRDLMQRCRESKDGGRGEPLCTIEQVRQMFGKNKIRLTPAAVKWLYDLANIPDSGALRTCSELVEIATITAEQIGHTTIDVPLLQAALRDSVQGDTFLILSAQLRPAETPRAARAG